MRKYADILMLTTVALAVVAYGLSNQRATPSKEEQVEAYRPYLPVGATNIVVIETPRNYPSQSEFDFRGRRYYRVGSTIFEANQGGGKR